MLNFPIEHVQEFLMLMRARINRRIQMANGAVLMRMEVSGESVLIYGFKAADGIVNIFDTTAALFDLFYLFPISCRLFYFHKKNVPPGTHQ